MQQSDKFTKEAKQGWRCARDAARIADGKAGIEDRRTHQAGSLLQCVQPAGVLPVHTGDVLTAHTEAS